MKFLRIFLYAAFIFAIAACNGKKGSIYDYPDDDPTTDEENGNIGDPCEKNIDCKTGLFCIDKVCSEPAEKDDYDTDSDTDPDKDGETVPDDDADSGHENDSDDNDDSDSDSDSDTDTDDNDEPEDTDTQPDEDSDTEPYTPECGNGVTEMGEECDDGFANSDEPGTYGSTCRTNCRFARCGDGITDSVETCDDGNRVNGDYCSADCSEITGWCGDGKIQVTIEACDNADKNIGSREGIGAYCASDCSEIVGSCGDGIKQSNEACDNANPGEGGGQGIGPHYCSFDCTEITGKCGDGIQQENEECDDGTGENGNGTYGHCNTTCTGTIYCGDGIVQPAYEKCDDGNNENGDYCSADCQTSNGSCGDSILQWFEICDKALDPYCSDDCKQIVGECGDNIVNGPEECDEGTNPNTGCAYGTVIGCEVCTENCTKAPGKLRYCGDGERQSDYEVCDDGNTENGDYCSADCQRVTGSCGDGFKQNNEACDKALDPYCSEDCKSIAGYCGDSIPNGDEECDGGPNPNTDCAYGLKSCKVCSTECKEIDGTPHFCGDETVDRENGEECDDEDLNGTYGHCKSDCSGIGEHCGDNVVNGPEDCDEGKGVNGTITDCAYDETSCKVCSANCTEIDGNISFCGDSRVDPDNEECDKALDPYCADDCQSITGECGDGKIQPNEACDKADPGVGEGEGTGAYCSFDCTESFGYCGDGIKKGPENCDDDKDKNGKYKLNYPPNCNADCSAQDSGYCGDNKIQNSSCEGISNCTEMSDAAEECDEGRDKNGKTQCEYGETSCTVCNSSCQIREGVTSRCGDGKLDQEHEACEKTLDPYCADDCKSTTGFCGDGTVQPNETCDKADPSVGEGQGIGDYCSSNCQTLLGECGDGKIQPNETCDKADPSVGEGEGTGAYCSFDCTQSFGYCGDGEWQNGIEVCEKTLDPYCADDCQSVTGYCGDGKIQPNEACDKADPSVGEGEGTGAYCSDNCSESYGYCGDNVIKGPEICDDGDGINGNGTYGHCNDNCDGYMPGCGDKKIQKGSVAECDAYVALDPNNKLCSDTITENCCEVVTGANETCDEGNGVNGTYGHCSSDCTFVMKCGDGIKQSNYGENCDDGDGVNGTYNHCSSDCRTLKTGYCGDGIRQNEDCGGDPKCRVLEGGDEECDNGSQNTNPNCPYGETSCTVCTTSCTAEPGKTAYCGDKKIQKGTSEECDAYVALDPENNKLCSDTITEDCCEVVEGTNENCDDGDENGNFGKCDDTCTETITWKCGDGVVDYVHGETCDDEDLNGTPRHCNSTCNGPTPYCGDGRTQREECTYLLQCDEEITENCCEIVTGMNEACDKGDENGNPRRCYNDCSGFCGDGKIQKEDCGSLPLCDENTTENCCVVAVGVNEDCDEGYDFNGQSGHCNQICTGSTAVCGNGELEYGEACDDGNTADNDYCSADCQRITGECGDGDKQDNEACDEGENNGLHGHCNLTCNGTSSCGDGELGKDEFCDPSSTEETMIAEIQCSELLQFGFTDETKIINSCTSDCVPILTTCEYNDAYKSPFFETGQTKCYSNSAEITCPTSGDFYGQEPNFNYTPHDYEAIANGEIIKDNATGLMWETATPSIYGVETGLEGYGYQECAATSSCTAYEANFYCKFLTLGGYDDWRQPTAAELSTITDYASATHMYSGFTNTSGSYWTDEGFVFSTADGTLTTPSIDDAKIKCVRSVSEESNCSALQCREKTADSMFIFDSPNTVIMVPENTESAGSIIFNFWRFDDLTVGDTWKNAIETCSSFDNLNGLDKMRLPTVNELMWLIDRTNGGSLIRGFAGTAWTSTTVNTAPSEAYAVDFLTGSVIRNSKDSSNIVICIE